jgi:predicted dehydrogenase
VPAVRAFLMEKIMARPRKASVAVIGVGGMGNAHLNTIKKIDNLELAAVCDIDRDIADKRAADHDVPAFYSHQALLKSGLVKAVVVATPHYDHTTIGIAALKAGLHVLVEKPISVHKADCQKLIAAHTKRSQVFSAMFNQRTDPHYIKLKALIDGGELGELTRINWIITSWFRSQRYYDSGGWRATWAGEGGGVLVNQCPHQLDLMTWLFGVPSTVRADVGIGKYHKIEVEDEVTAYLTYPKGATGIFITSTGEAPGTNRLEVVGTRGKVVVEGGDGLRFTRNEVVMDEFCKTSEAPFATPPVWDVAIPVRGHGLQHEAILRNFANAITKKEKLIAPAAEGIKSVELGNAMLLSGMTGKTITMPLSAPAYARHLKKLIATSTFKKNEAVRSDADMGASFNL